MEYSKENLKNNSTADLGVYLKFAKKRVAELSENPELILNNHQDNGESTPEWDAEINIQRRLLIHYSSLVELIEGELEERLSNIFLM